MFPQVFLKCFKWARSRLHVSKRASPSNYWISTSKWLNFIRSLGASLKLAAGPATNYISKICSQGNLSRNRCLTIDLLSLPLLIRFLSQGQYFSKVLQIPVLSLHHQTFVLSLHLHVQRPISESLQVSQQFFGCLVFKVYRNQPLMRAVEAFR